jgi:hypothetical protein
MLEYLNGPSDSYRVYNRYQTFTGELAFEIGANRGWLASVWAGQFDHVVACEPHPGSYQALTDVYGQPDFVKIDTEGHEVQVLDGGLETFAQGPEFLIEVHSRAKGDAVYMILRKLGLEFEVMRHRSSPIPGSNWYDHYWFLSP